MFDKILIANRGEIAVRVVRACRDMGISPVAVYSDVDREALHVKLADEAYPIGGAAAADSYLRIDRIIDVARRSGAGALHPGYGFLAENAAFAQACHENGITFIGPSADAIERMGSKIASRRLVEKAGIPVVPGSRSGVKSIDDLRRQAAALGFPVLLKASAGGGGKGMRIVEQAEDLESAFVAARGEAQSAFADSTLYVERYIRRSRHIEVQLLGDRHGTLLYLGERECSVQRRHQKVVEECPSPLVNAELRQQLGDAAVAVARSVQYEGAGTVEFLVDASDDGAPFYFLEMNTRLQVEHAVTEMVTGIDLVVEQIRIAAGQALGYCQDDIRMKGAAMECRIYAEDPYQGFLPSPGQINTLFEPSGPGVRNDTGVFAGWTIPVEYDPLISKLITWGRDRPQAINRMTRALSEYRIGGVRTTLPFFDRLLCHPEFVAGNLHTGFIEEHGLSQPPARSNDSDQQIAVAAAALYYRRLARQRHPSKPASPTSRWLHRSWRSWP